MRTKLTPKDAVYWIECISRQSQRQSVDAATKWQVRIMMNYIKKVLMYQEKMDPSVDEEGKFTCPRCKETMIAESGTVEDYKFCPLCGQRWKEDEDDD